MAVTQILARLAPELLARCSADPASLRELVSFRLIGTDCYLDLDWAPAGLERLAQASALSSEARDALRAACKGNRAVNPRFPAGEVEFGPFGLDADDVCRVAAGLELIDSDTLLAPLPHGSTDGHELTGDSIAVQERAQYYRSHFGALCEFYARAAQRREAVVVWWD